MKNVYLVDGVTKNELRWHCVSHWFEWFWWHYINERVPDDGASACISCAFCELCDKHLQHGGAPNFLILDSVPGGHSPEWKKIHDEELFTAHARNRRRDG